MERAVSIFILCFLFFFSLEDEEVSIRLTATSAKVKPTQEDLESYWGANLQPLGLVDHHQSVVLTVFIDAGLIEVFLILYLILFALQFLDFLQSWSLISTSNAIFNLDLDIAGCGQHSSKDNTCGFQKSFEKSNVVDP